METVIDALSAMGKTTCRELAARMKIEPREALEMLREQEEIGTVALLNGYWSVPGDKSPTAPSKTKLHQIAEPKAAARKQGEKSIKPAKTASAVPSRPPRSESALSREILAGLVGEPRISTEALTAKTGRKARSLNAALGFLAKEGLVDRHVDKNNITWSLPGAAEPAVMHQQENEAQPRTVTAVLDSITPFAAPRPDDLLIPTVRGVNREIRRARAKVVQLEKLRDAVRELGKHRRLIREVLL